MDCQDKDYYSIAKIELFEEWLKHSKSDQLTMLYRCLCSRYDISGITEASIRETKNTISRFSSNLMERWTRSGKCKERFLKNHSDWMRGDLVFQNRFKQELGLIVDKPKPGYGNSNDGNTARRFFRNPEQSAEITGLDVNLLKKFDIILRVLSSEYDINIQKFSDLAKDTRQLYLSLYSWYYMPATVHKILVHGAEVIQSALLPIGQLSEEAQEARNKDCRRFRENNTRKRSRIATNRDLLNMLLITSDPVINSFRDITRKMTGNLPSEVLDVFLPSYANTCENTGSLETIDSNDYVVDDSSNDEFSDND